MKRKENKKDIANLMLNSCFNCHSEEATEVMRAFAGYVGGFKVNRETAPLFLRILAINNPSVITNLLKHRNPFFVFRSIKPNEKLLQQTFDILSDQDPISIYQPVLLALLGIIDTAYKNPSEGNTEREITLFDLNHIAKYLNEKQNQFFLTNKIILQILEYFYYGEYETIPDTAVKTPAIHAMRIRFAFFDKKHSLADIVPEQLLGPAEDTAPQICKNDRTILLDTISEEF